MNRLFTYRVLGLIAVALALAATSLTARAYYYATRRDEQARAVPLREERGEHELAEQHRRGAEVLGKMSMVLVETALFVAVLALVLGALPVLKAQRWDRWAAGVTVVLLAVCLALGLASRPS